MKPFELRLVKRRKAEPSILQPAAELTGQSELPASGLPRVALIREPIRKMIDMAGERAGMQLIPARSRRRKEVGCRHLSSPLHTLASEPAGEDCL